MRNKDPAQPEIKGNMSIKIVFKKKTLKKKSLRKVHQLFVVAVE